ncbi:beta-glucuronidase [Glycomyces sp. A-F 0318]|nr:beta-glucuronidase [Glycomyces amatae]
MDGVWRFAADYSAAGHAERWWSAELPGTVDMPVPASYNDLLPDERLRDHVGLVWYQTHARPPRSWEGRRIVLRFDGAAHDATVWVGDTIAARHTGGFLPFEVDVTDLLACGERNRITVALSNELSFSSMPPGRSHRTPAGTVSQALTADYFNYTGLHRHVWLYATPADHIEDVAVRTRLDGSTGLIDYDVTISGSAEVSVRLRDAQGGHVSSAVGAASTLEVPEAHLWEPGAGYLYRLEVEYGQDIYEVPVGIRTIEVDGRRFLINGKPFTFKGVGRHEDSPIRGRGHDDALMVHDFALLDWLGANSLRTTHYPYPEEALDYADRHGVVVIDETAAGMVNLAMDFGPRTGPPPETFGPEGFGAEARDACVRAARELIERDRNHPSVVMWCLSNEPDSAADGAREFLAPIVAEARALDPTRPVCFTNVFLAPPERDRITDLFDMVCLNRYQGWYVNGGDLASAELELRAELDRWAERYDKPILITECGADSLAGLHETAPTMWTEEYQSAVIAMVARVAEQHDAVAGQHVWSFADFLTRQEVIRPGGNLKGLFTRDRKPKAAAFDLRRRWIES